MAIPDTTVPNVRCSCYMSCIFIALFLASQVGSKKCSEAQDDFFTRIWTTFVEPMKRFFSTPASQQPLNIEADTVGQLLDACFENGWLAQEPEDRREGEQCAAEFALFLGKKMFVDRDYAVLRQKTSYPDGSSNVCPTEHESLKLTSGVYGSAIGAISLDALFDAAFNSSLEDGVSTQQAVVYLPKMVIVQVNRTKFNGQTAERCARPVKFSDTLDLGRSRCILCCVLHFLSYLHVANSMRIPTHRIFWLQIS